MLKSLAIRNFTVFPDANLRFAKNLNVVVGENGSGKTHILKLAYSGIATSANLAREHSDSPGKAQWQMALAAKLKGVFRPDGLGRLVRRSRGRSKCDLSFTFDQRQLSFQFGFDYEETLSAPVFDSKSCFTESSYDLWSRWHLW